MKQDDFYGLLDGIREAGSSLRENKNPDPKMIKTPIQIATEARAELVARAASEIASAEAEETKREATMPTRADMEHAVEVLSSSQRGRDTMQSVLNLLDDHALGLDYPNQNAVMTILRAAWGPFAGSTRECMAEALEAARPAKKRAR